SGCGGLNLEKSGTEWRTTGVEEKGRKRRSAKEFLLRPAVRLAVLVASLVVIVSTGATALLTDQEASEGQQWALRSYEVRHQLGRLNVAGAEARAAAFSSLLGSEAARKQDLEQQTATMRLLVERLGELVKDNPAQIERLNQIEPLVEQQTAELKRCVRAKECDQAAIAAVERRRAQLGKLVSAMDGDERELLKGRLHDWNT